VSTTVFVQIGNTDNKLTQQEWSHFVSDTRLAIRGWAREVHFDGGSDGDAPWQNHCWAAEFTSSKIEALLRGELRVLAQRYRQDSIAWSEAEITDFIHGVAPVAKHAPTCECGAAGVCAGRCIWPRFLLLLAIVAVMFGWPHVWKWFRNTPNRDRHNSDTDG
jgi:hypothetical protein